MHNNFGGYYVFVGSFANIRTAFNSGRQVSPWPRGNSRHAESSHGEQPHVRARRFWLSDEKAVTADVPQQSPFITEKLRQVTDLKVTTPAGADYYLDLIHNG